MVKSICSCPNHDCALHGASASRRRGSAGNFEELNAECGVDNLRQRAGDQPLPLKNGYPAIQDLVIADMEARKAVGMRRYGTLLQPHNGRDFLRDMYEELLDAANYARGLMYERDGK